MLQFPTVDFTYRKKNTVNSACVAHEFCIANSKWIEGDRKEYQSRQHFTID